MHSKLRHDAFSYGRRQNFCIKGILEMHLERRGENRYLRTLLYVRRIVHDKLQLMTVKNVHARKKPATAVATTTNWPLKAYHQ